MYCWLCEGVKGATLDEVMTHLQQGHGMTLEQAARELTHDESDYDSLALRQHEALLDSQAAQD